MRFWDVLWESLAIAAEYASNNIQGPVVQNLTKLLGNVAKQNLYTLIPFAENKKKLKKKKKKKTRVAFALLLQLKSLQKNISKNRKPYNLIAK